MKIGGLQKTSFVDYPGKVVAVVFTLGCNFRCPFCHNGFLVNGDKEVMSQNAFFEFLEKKKKVLDGVCVSGGEPMIQTDIFDFIKKIKDMGMAVKLDTNGTRPEELEKLVDANLVDYVAMDFKNRLCDYAKTVGLKKVEVENIKKSMKILAKSGVEFELRTTIVPGLHTREGLIGGARELVEIAGKKVDWYWQNFRPIGCLDESYCKKRNFGVGELEKWMVDVKKVLKNVRLK